MPHAPWRGVLAWPRGARRTVHGCCLRRSCLCGQWSVLTVRLSSVSCRHHPRRHTQRDARRRETLYRQTTHYTLVSKSPYIIRLVRPYSYCSALLLARRVAVGVGRTSVSVDVSWCVRVSHSDRHSDLAAGAGAARASVVSVLCKDAPNRPGGARQQRALARWRSARRHRSAARGGSCPSATCGASALSVLRKDAPYWLGGAIEQRALARRRSSRGRRRRGRRGRRQWLRMVVAPLHTAPLAPFP